MRSSVSFLLRKVGAWQRSGQVSPTGDSLTTRINEASLAREISLLDKKDMLEWQSELKVAIACLKMADAFNTAKRICRTAVETETIDVLIHGVDELTEVLSTSGDERLIMIQKNLSDFLHGLKTSEQTTSKEQGDYEHSDEEVLSVEPKGEERSNVG
jgi:hypothetical protein